MSRRILPRRGSDPVQIVQPFGFTAAQRQQILDALPCLCGEESEFIAGLECCASTFLWLRNQYRARSTQAEQNAALTEIAHLTGELTEKLRSLDIETEWASFERLVEPQQGSGLQDYGEPRNSAGRNE